MKIKKTKFGYRKASWFEEHEEAIMYTASIACVIIMVILACR